MQKKKDLGLCVICLYIISIHPVVFRKSCGTESLLSWRLFPWVIAHPFPRSSLSKHAWDLDLYALGIFGGRESLLDTERSMPHLSQSGISYLYTFVLNRVWDSLSSPFAIFDTVEIAFCLRSHMKMKKKKSALFTLEDFRKRPGSNAVIKWVYLHCLLKSDKPFKWFLNV